MWGVDRDAAIRLRGVDVRTAEDPIRRFFAEWNLNMPSDAATLHFFEWLCGVGIAGDESRVIAATVVQRARPVLACASVEPAPGLFCEIASPEIAPTGKSVAAKARNELRTAAPDQL